MSINYSALASQVRSVISGIGVTATISRAGKNLGTTKLVFGKIAVAEVVSDAQSRISRLNSTTRTAYIGTITTPPAPGDVVTTKGVNYKIKAVDIYQPASTAIAYKLELT